MTSQQPAPANVMTQVVSARPEASSNFHNATAAPAQTGRSSNAMANLNHFSTRQENEKGGAKTSGNTRLDTFHFARGALKLCSRA